MKAHNLYATRVQKETERYILDAQDKRAQLVVGFWIDRCEGSKDTQDSAHSGPAMNW